MERRCVCALYGHGHVTSCDVLQAVRDVVWSMTNDDLRTFVERNHNKEYDGECVVVIDEYLTIKPSFFPFPPAPPLPFVAVVEHVRDGATVRLILLPSFTVLMVTMSGIKV